MHSAESAAVIVKMARLSASRLSPGVLRSSVLTAWGRTASG